MRNLLLSAWVLHILTCQYVLSSTLNVLRRQKRYADVERVLVKGTGLLPNETLLVQSSSSVVHVVKDYEFKVTYVTCLGVAPHDRKIGGCHFEDNELSGIIKSPTYPAFYPLEAYCEAKVEVPYGNVIRFRIEDIDLCPRAGNVLTFIDGEGLGGPKLKVVTPESEEKEGSLNGTIISPGRKVTVVLSASCQRGAKNRGFHITYEAQPSETSDGKGTSTSADKIGGLDQGACGKPVLANPGDATNQEGSKIVRGNDAKIGAHPWQVLLKHVKTDDPFCGGSLISHRWVLTAAHCFKQYSRHDVRVVLGKHSLVTRDENEITLSIKKLVIHPDFENRTLNNDIALLELRAAIQYSARFSPICLGDAQFIEQMAFRSPTPVLGFASGWGRVNIKGPRPENLQEVRLPVLSKQVCLESSSAAVRKKITDNMFCAGYDDQPVVMDTCEGDSGGPFVVELRGTWYLVGIVSWSHQSKCGVPGRYGFYTKVNNYNEWILDTVNSRRSGMS
ncbi:prothrombin-like isoform X2 [Haemaphysalis longicornis]